MIIGYTTGVFDLFHIGHLNIIKQSIKKYYGSYIIVYNEDEKRNIVNSGIIEEDKVFVVGCPRVDYSFNINKLEKKESNKVTLVYYCIHGMGDDIIRVFFDCWRMHVFMDFGRIHSCIYGFWANSFVYVCSFCELNRFSQPLAKIC